MKNNQNQVSQTERQKAKAIAQALSGGSKARAGRLEVSIMAVLAAFGGTITHFEKAQPVAPPAEVPLDESWAEPVVFDGCSSKGQAKPGQAQPVHIVRKSAVAQGAST